jgi:hypothetical protein
MQLRFVSWWRLFALFLLTLSPLLIGGCSDSEDEVTFAVTGVVRDFVGNPVANARVSIEYQYVIDTIPWSSAGTLEPQPDIPISFDLREAGEWSVRIADYSGRLVRVFEGSDEAGSHMIVWDGTDENGRPLPAGVYLAQLKAGDISAEVNFFRILSCEEMRTSDASTVITDSDGKFAESWDIVPLGESWLTTNELGGSRLRYTISDTIHVCAWSGESGGSQLATLKRGSTIGIDVTVQ